MSHYRTLKPFALFLCSLEELCKKVMSKTCGFAQSCRSVVSAVVENAEDDRNPAYFTEIQPGPLGAISVFLETVLLPSLGKR